MQAIAPDTEEALLGVLERQRALLHALRVINANLDAGDIAPPLTAGALVSARAELIEAVTEQHQALAERLLPDTYGRGRPAPAEAPRNGAEASAP